MATNIRGANLAENRRARFDYEIAATYTAGIELRGYEVKSVRNGQFQIAGARVLIRGNSPRKKEKSGASGKAANSKASGGASGGRTGEAWLVNSHIPPYQPKNTPPGYEEDRARRLLLTGSEINELTGALQEKGRMLIPLRVFMKNGFVKLELGLARPRKNSDKREVIKKRSHQREMRDEG